jgi:excisionase family DNA binding protein
MVDGRYMTIDETADYLRLSRETLYKYVQRGVIPAAKVGRHWRFDRQAIDQWMSSQAEASRVEGISDAAAAPVPAGTGPWMNVLVVDDDVAIRRLLEVWIRGEGHRVDLAGNGAEAMTLLTSRTYDLVFLDLHMPDLTGGQVLGRLQEYDDRPPVVLITGFSETPMMDQALHYDLLYVLSKPFVREQVLKLLHSVRATKVLPYTDSSPARSAGYVPSARPVA